jgi:hypothetical protein
MNSEVRTLAQNDVPTSIRIIGAGWLGLALVVTASGALLRAPVPTLPLTVAGLTVFAIALAWGTAAGRAFVDRLSLPALAWFQAWRVVPGAAFLLLFALDRMPGRFAIPAGVGDVAVALLAPLAAQWASKETRAARLAFAAWVAAGTFDLLGVVRLAAVVSLDDASSMQLLRELPLGLLPTFAVPLTFVAHAITIRHLLRGRGQGRVTPRD